MRRTPRQTTSELDRQPDKVSIYQTNFDPNDPRRLGVVGRGKKISPNEFAFEKLFAGQAACPASISTTVKTSNPFHKPRRN